ncbi:VOC family protein [Amycolatopsis umgeniensis]|uniref:Putative enzyme related to lactoylglutathione lyase n=1 Tax=Amycolatopsis umgeniensis TaxID=336628 RepID=A0A841BH35_9PSEU|nr:VOC family protein [Amycolatopsis umgeniensis]MBB5858178.1 putative enzyme related to lactoylglutathione lyase [Amycolatopsis umgeniensis]
MTGRVVHFEIPFEDGDRARGFYREVFGWKADTLPGMGYTMVSSGPTAETGMPSEPGFINGGMLSREVSAAAGPVIVLDVDSIDDTLTVIEKQGGSTLVGRTAVGQMGFSAYFKDPEGNVIGLWETAGQG